MEEKPVIIKASHFAKKAHHGQKRKSGEPYFEHVKETAKIISEWGLGETTISAAFLHDVVEDTPVTLEEIKKEFGEEIAFLVDGVTKLGHVKYRGTVTEMENMRKFILAISQDIRVILIKLADRLHNMKTLFALPLSKQKRIASETLEIYAPLAYRLSMFELSGYLEDLCFAYLQPKEFKWLKDNVKKRYQERKEYVKRITPAVKEELNKNQINIVEINSRAKRYYSLYKKLQRYDMNLDQIYDLVAIRCIVKNLSDCYTTLGIIHGRWLPLLSRIKDYIAMPKANGYKSLHTTIFGPEQQLIEIQIRTQEMHQEAEYGIAAHWAYHQNKGTLEYKSRQATLANQKELAWVKKLQTWQSNLQKPKEFMNILKTELLEDQVLVLTPKSQIIELPKGSTPIDFAYKIHSDIGNSCVGAKVNKKIVPLDIKLKTSDIVEILVQKNKKPSENWLEFIKTSQARHHIKNYLRRKHNRLIKPVPAKTEFKILVENRVGILKDIANVISRVHINITDHQSRSENFGDNFHVIKIGCQLNDKRKAEQIINKLKKVKGVEKADYKLI